MPHTTGIPSCVGGSWKTKSVCKTTTSSLFQPKNVCFRYRLLVSIKVQQANDLWLRRWELNSTFLVMSQICDRHTASAIFTRLIMYTFQISSRVYVKVAVWAFYSFILFDCINIIAEFWEKVKILNGRNFLIILHVVLVIQSNFIISLLQNFRAWWKFKESRR